MSHSQCSSSVTQLRFHSPLSSIYSRVADWDRRQKKRPSAEGQQFCSLTSDPDLCLELPGVSERHLGHLDVHLQGVVRRVVPPVGYCLFIGCWNVGKILREEKNL